MRFDNQLMAPVALALLTALVVSFLMTPVVKSFAYKVGAIDVPKDERRMHHKPIPRLGGLAIFAGGNETAPMAGFPGAADFCISVSATAADYTPAVYTLSLIHI